MNTNTATPTAEAIRVEQAFAEYLEELPSAKNKATRDMAREHFRRMLGQRCRAARGAMEVNDAAARIGVHRNTIWNIERGDSLPDAFELELLARVYGTTPAVLLGDADTADGVSAAPARSVTAVELGDFIYIPHFDLTVSAGPGAFQDLEHVVAMRPFDVGYIRQELGISHLELALCGVTGRSALPDLKPKDTILVDLRDRAVLTEGMHVIRLDDVLMLKQVQRLPGKVLRVSSKNEEFQSFEISAAEDSQRDFEIIGRVRWGGVTFY